MLCVAFFVEAIADGGPWWRGRHFLGGKVKPAYEKYPENNCHVVPNCDDCPLSGCIKISEEAEMARREWWTILLDRTADLLDKHAAAALGVTKGTLIRWRRLTGKAGDRTMGSRHTIQQKAAMVIALDGLSEFEAEERSGLDRNTISSWRRWYYVTV